MHLELIPDEIAVHVSSFISSPVEHHKFRNSCPRLASIIPKFYVFNNLQAVFRFNKEFRMLISPPRGFIRMAFEPDHSEALQIIDKCSSALAVSCFGSVSDETLCRVALWAPLKVFFLLVSAVKMLDCILMRRLMEVIHVVSSPAAACARTIYGKMAGLIAAQGSNSDLFWFLSCFKDDLDEISAYKLIRACVNRKKVEWVSYFWKKGFKFNLHSRNGSYLHVAIRSGCEEIVDLALSSMPKCNERYRHGVDPIIHEACRMGNPAILIKLLHAGYNPNLRDFHGNNALQIVRMRINSLKLYFMDDSRQAELRSLKLMEIMLLRYR